VAAAHTQSGFRFSFCFRFSFWVCPMSELLSLVQLVPHSSCGVDLMPCSHSKATTE